MPLRIEIDEQPNQRRFWASVEVAGNFYGTLIARRKDVNTPQVDGVAGILAAVAAAVEEITPKPPVPKDEAMAVAPDGPDLTPHALILEHASEAPPLDPGPLPDLAEGDTRREAEIDALRAQLTALGAHVDLRWREQRLHEEIAAVKTAVELEEISAIDAAGSAVEGHV